MNASELFVIAVVVLICWYAWMRWRDQMAEPEELRRLREELACVLLVGEDDARRDELTAAIAAKTLKGS